MVDFHMQSHILGPWAKGHFYLLIVKWSTNDTGSYYFAYFSLKKEKKGTQNIKRGPKSPKRSPRGTIGEQCIMLKHGFLSEINCSPPPQIFGLVGPPKKRVNRDKLNHRQKLQVLCFNQQFCAKINYFSSIQCFILTYHGT